MQRLGAFFLFLLMIGLVMDVSAQDQAQPLTVSVWTDPLSGQHMSVILDLASEQPKISGVWADNSRSNPVRHSLDLTADDVATLTALQAEISAMPLCEPPASWPDEPYFKIQFPDGLEVEEPNIFLRSDYDPVVAAEDPCTAFARLAEHIFRRWTAEFPSPW
ncbi:MAG: hypothetical protein KC561_12260 [Myxococcales bacterium]|nr:hypothetical protein [Myxococcales bacterium]